MKPIGYIHSDFTDRFGIPRQSGLVETEAYISFEKPFNDPSAFVGIEDYSHIWIIWEFSKSIKEGWSPMVRPPRLGGNKKVGVFASRAPFRPNPIGLSVVKLLSVDKDSKGSTILRVSGVDMLDGTPVFDIKPYLPYTESIPHAAGGFSSKVKNQELQVFIPESLAKDLSLEEKEILLKLLAQDPRPHYQKDPDRIYKMSYKKDTVSFKVNENQLEVVAID